jgi:hypothetical protein
MAMHMLSALSGHIDAVYVCHPVFPRLLEYTTLVQSSLTNYPRQIVRCDAQSLNPHQIRQFYLLQLAMNKIRYTNMGQQQMLDAWSLRLFQRYLLADPSIREDEANSAILEDLRTIMETILLSFLSLEASFHSKAARLRRYYQPANGLDPDLVPSLAWEYGRLFVEGWRDMLKIRRYISINSICGAAQPPNDTHFTFP